MFFSHIPARQDGFDESSCTFFLAIQGLQVSHCGHWACIRTRAAVHRLIEMRVEWQLLHTMNANFVPNPDLRLLDVATAAPKVLLTFREFAECELLGQCRR